MDLCNWSSITCNKYIVHDADAALFLVLDHLSQERNILILSGNLGSGKTFLAKKIINSILDQDLNVTSPTFGLWNIYNNKDITINHFDLYRIKSIDELFQIGFTEAISDNISIIEWPNLAIPLLYKDSIIAINIDFQENQSDRIYTIKI